MYSAQSVRANLFSDFPVNKKIGIHTSLGFGPVLLAAVPNSYLYNTRDYDYGPGMAFNGAARLSIAGILSYSVNYRGGWMYTVSGNATSYYLHAITNEVSVRIVKEVSLSAESGSFNLHGNYRHFDTVDKTYPYLRLSIRYNPIFF